MARFRIIMQDGVVIIFDGKDVCRTIRVREKDD